jgi:hypothetical protein
MRGKTLEKTRDKLEDNIRKNLKERWRRLIWIRTGNIG